MIMSYKFLLTNLYPILFLSSNLNMIFPTEMFFSYTENGNFILLPSTGYSFQNRTFL